MEILLIEDDATIGKAVQRGLGEAGHGARWVSDGKAGLGSAFACVVLVIVTAVASVFTRYVDSLQRRPT